MSALFGPGGNSKSFYDEGFKSTFQAPGWVKSKGLDAYEYEGGQGIRGSAETFAKIGDEAKKNGIRMSVHAPYFISLSSVEEEKRLGSAKYIIDSARCAKALGAETIVIHAGSTAKLERGVALEYAKAALYHAIEKLCELELYDGILLGIETMGKVNQLGTLDEVIEMCRVDKNVRPVVDFGHMNARELGGVFTSSDDYKRIFDRIGTELCPEYADKLHCHFSKIEYTKGGEKKHLTFSDSHYGPDFEPLMKAIADLGVSPTIICESDGTMAEDALAMKTEYLRNLR
ncbi:MAG: TIM barrel protein [Clostridia bacterium]|nr:TIM barrel protein [Clostridia bacterium]